MKVIDVYMQYFAADCVFNDVPRHAAVVKLTSTSDEGVITYEVSVSFFPFNDPEEFGISYDAFFSKISQDVISGRKNYLIMACQTH